MSGKHVTALAVLAAVAFVPVHAAEGKLGISLALEPAHPVAGQLVRVTLRTDVVLPRKHGLELTVIGPWRDAYGQSFLDPRLVRVGPRQFRAAVRFPHTGRWRLIVPNSHLDRTVRVRPRR